MREVSPGGPAAEAGIRAGDMIVAVNGTAVKARENPARTVSETHACVKPDSRCRVRVLREGSPHEFTVTARAGPGFFFADFPRLEGPELLAGHPEPLLMRGPVTATWSWRRSPRSLGQLFRQREGRAGGTRAVRRARCSSKTAT